MYITTLLSVPLDSPTADLPQQWTPDCVA